MVEFNINKYIKLKLEENKTTIYILNKRFKQCKYLFLLNPIIKKKYLEINSIDEAKHQLRTELEKKIKPQELGITPIQEFWGHSSNLQAWAENNYDTRLLHSKLAFPLLKTLVEAGDIKAKKVFKEEIAKRMISGYPNVLNYLINENYLEFLDKEELDFVFDEIDYKAILNQRVEKSFRLLDKLIRLGANNARIILKEEIKKKLIIEFSSILIRKLHNLITDKEFMQILKENEKIFIKKLVKILKEREILDLEYYIYMFFEKIKKCSYGYYKEIIKKITKKINIKEMTPWLYINDTNI